MIKVLAVNVSFYYFCTVETYLVFFLSFPFFFCSCCCFLGIGKSRGWKSEECFQRVIRLSLAGYGGAWGSSFYYFLSCYPMQLTWKRKRIISSSGNQVGMSWLFFCPVFINEKTILSILVLISGGVGNIQRGKIDSFSL